MGCGRNTAPQQTFDEPQEGMVEIESVYRDTIKTIDTIYIKEYIKQKPETIYVSKRIKVKDSYNVDNSEVTKLKDAVLIRDSQIDSLTIQLGKKCVGQQTNNGTKWWIFVLLGMAIGVSGYQGIRSAITKKW